MRYAPYADVADRPHVVVDGSAQAGTVLTLSHWPGSPTPEVVRDDLSAQIAFRALDHPELLDGLELVTNNHVDQDGLVGVFALCEPDLAHTHRERLIDVARAGDFSCFHERASARAAIALAELANAADGDGYIELLPRLLEVVEHPDRFRAHWDAEDSHISETEAAIADGTITIEELADVDLAVVTVPPDWARRTIHRFTTTDSLAAHPYAVYNATNCLRVLTVGAGAPDVRFRYETWVHLVFASPGPTRGPRDPGRRAHRRRAGRRPLGLRPDRQPQSRTAPGREHAVRDRPRPDPCTGARDTAGGACDVVSVRLNCVSSTRVRPRPRP